MADTITTTAPTAAVRQAHEALRRARADLDAISPDYPAFAYGASNPVWHAYMRQAHTVRMLTWDLHHAILDHYEQLTGIRAGGCNA